MKLPLHTFSDPVRRLSAPALAALAIGAAPAMALEVTGSFTGWWDQPDQQNHGVIVSISQLPNGEKTGVLYWANYDEEGNPSWLIAQGGIQGDTINADLYQVDGVTFMQPRDPDADPAEPVGTMQVQFSNCSEGDVSFETPTVIVGTGSFRISRITNQPGTNCSGGIGDDAGPKAHRSKNSISTCFPPASSAAPKAKRSLKSRPAGPNSKSRSRMFRLVNMNSRSARSPAARLS